MECPCEDAEAVLLEAVESARSDRRSRAVVPETAAVRSCDASIYPDSPVRSVGRKMCAVLLTSGIRNAKGAVTIVPLITCFFNPSFG